MNLLKVWKKRNLALCRALSLQGQQGGAQATGASEYPDFQTRLLLFCELMSCALASKEREALGKRNVMLKREALKHLLTNTGIAATAL